VVKINRRIVKMAGKFTDKLENVRGRLQDIQSSAETLREALYYSQYDCGVFTGAANLIVEEIEVAANELRDVVKEMLSA